jgi:hypothetical protein
MAPPMLEPVFVDTGYIVSLPLRLKEAVKALGQERTAEHAIHAS